MKLKCYGNMKMLKNIKNINLVQPICTEEEKSCYIA